MFTAQNQNTSWLVHSVSGLEKEATDKRDHVYGLLAVSKLPILIDYNKSVGEVFAAMTMECLWKDAVAHLDDILGLAGIGLPSYTPDMPSWTPFPQKKTFAKIPYSMLRKGQSASSGLFEQEQKFVFGPQDLTITLRGVVMVSVVRERAIPDNVALYGGSMLSFLHDVLTEDFMPADGLAIQFAEALGPSILVENWLPEYTEEVDLELLGEYAGVRGHSLFVTQEGYVGRGPRGLLPGDVTAVLEGSRITALLRENPDAESFRHVGTFYAYGLNDGEAPKFWIEQGYTEIAEFTLR
ncbi:hypothetical protein RB597_001995 [Gaeumannomyces tritici]